MLEFSAEHEGQPGGVVQHIGQQISAYTVKPEFKLGVKLRGCQKHG